MTDAMIVTRPAFPSSMRVRMMRRRIGWLTTDSDSLVVKPTPVIADRAWNLATSYGTPVAINATVAIRVTSSANITTTKSVAIAITCYHLSS